MRRKMFALGGRGGPDVYVSACRMAYYKWWVEMMLGRDSTSSIRPIWCSDVRIRPVYRRQNRRIAVTSPKFNPSSHMLVNAIQAHADDLLGPHHVSAPPGREPDRAVDDWLLTAHGQWLEFEHDGILFRSNGVKARNWLLMVCGPNQLDPESLRHVEETARHNGVRTVVLPISPIPDFGAWALEQLYVKYRMWGLGFIESLQFGLECLWFGIWDADFSKSLDRAVHTHIAPALAKMFANCVADCAGYLHAFEFDHWISSPWFNQDELHGLLSVIDQQPQTSQSDTAYMTMIGLIERNWEKMRERKRLPTGEITRLVRAMHIMTIEN